MSKPKVSAKVIYQNHHTWFVSK